MTTRRIWNMETKQTHIKNTGIINYALEEKGKYEERERKKVREIQQ